MLPAKYKIRAFFRMSRNVVRHSNKIPMHKMSDFILFRLCTLVVLKYWLYIYSRYHDSVWCLSHLVRKKRINLPLELKFGMADFPPCVIIFFLQHSSEVPTGIGIYTHSYCGKVPSWPLGGVHFLEQPHWEMLGMPKLSTPSFLRSRLLLFNASLM